jgi:hypothetical protein
MKAAFRIALKIFKWLAIGIVSLVIIVVACWFFVPDEKVNPEGEKWLARQAAPPAEQNGYFLLWGLLASRELDPHETGQKIVAEHERQLATDIGLAKFKPETFLGAQPLKAKATRKRCQIEIEKCLPFYQVTRTDYKTDIANHALQMERYRSLRGYPKFSEKVMTYTVTSPLPYYSTFSTMSDLVDADIGFNIATPATRKRALEELALEIELWRRIARESDALITQMIAVNLLNRKYHLASEIMEAYPEVVRQHPDKMAEITAPIPLNESTLTRPLQNEFRLFAQLFGNLDRASKIMYSNEDFNGKLQDAMLRVGAFKPNASINQAYIRFDETIKLCNKSPKEAVAGRAALMERLSTAEWKPQTLLFNPIGRMLEVDSAPDFTSYAYRLFDLVGLSRMVELQRRSIVEARPTGRLPNRPVKDVLANPYTEQPFDWDVAKGTISFIGHGGRNLKDGRTVIRAGVQ